MKEMKDMMLLQNEAALQQEIARADGQQTAIESSLQQLSVGGGTQVSEESDYRNRADRSCSRKFGNSKSLMTRFERCVRKHSQEPFTSVQGRN